jgi:hypothetical protein
MDENNAVVGYNSHTEAEAAVKELPRAGFEMKRLALLFCIWVFFFTFVIAANAAIQDDAYIAGYAAAILERDFRVPSASLQVQDGVIRLNSDDLSGVDQQQLVTALTKIRGVVHVELRGQGQLLASASAEPPSSSPLRRDGQAIETDITSTGSKFLPQGYLFDQLLADPRWPHFSLAYRYHIRDKELVSAGAANFGETFALYRDRVPSGGLWEFGIQAGVFSLFDLDTESSDLINADYMGGIFASYRYNDFSTMLRVFHQSSHLGDEFVLRDRVNRVNLSYEQVDFKLSYRFLQALRLYGGGGYLFDQEPSGLKPWTVQYGVEFESPWRLNSGAITPILAVDLKNEEENHWSTNLSLRAGVQFEPWKFMGRRLQLLIEYFNGHSPNGQFYNRKIKTIGIGTHLRF